MGKIDNSSKRNIKKSGKSLCEFESKGLDQHSNIAIVNLWIDWENLCPNLSYTVENKASNSHKKKLITFHTSWMKYSILQNFKNLSMNCWGNMFSIWKKWTFETIAVTASFVNGFAETVFRTKVQYAFVPFLQIKCLSFLMSHFCICFTSELTQILFYVSLFRFNFVSALQYLGCHYNEHLVR